MKRVSIALMAVVLTGCSTTITKSDSSPKDKWVNVTDAQNKIVAAFNTADGKIVYYADPKEAFEVMLGAYQGLVAEVQKRAADLKPEEKKKAVKK